MPGGLEEALGGWGWPAERDSGPGLGRGLGLAAELTRPSPQVHPNSVHICAVVVEYETKAGRINKGVATNWLRAKEPAGENGGRALVPMFVRKSQFRLPFKATTPVIMVGPGTGVAPFIGFIQERAWLRQQGERGPAGEGVTTGDLTLTPAPATQARRWGRRCCTMAAAARMRTTCTGRSWRSSTGTARSPSSTWPSPGSSPTR